MYNPLYSKISLKVIFRDNLLKEKKQKDKI